MSSQAEKFMLAYANMEQAYRVLEKDVYVQASMPNVSHQVKVAMGVMCAAFIAITGAVNGLAERVAQLENEMGWEEVPVQIMDPTSYLN